MDLGIKGRQAIVCGSSKGLGKACADLLATADELRAVGPGDVRAITADVTTEEGREALFAACPEPDILVNNAGGPPPGDFRDWRQNDWFDAVNANMYSAIDMIRRSLDGMVEREFGRIVNITSVAVKLPVEELGQHNVTINNLLPGYFATDRLKSLFAKRAAEAGEDPDEFFAATFAGTPTGRPGDPDEFGAACAFLCSAHAGYVTAQNFLIDGGLYPGTF
jgi:3-oxoacyl-[acyl-carrier protein] reductase